MCVAVAVECGCMIHFSKRSDKSNWFLVNGCKWRSVYILLHAHRTQQHTHTQPKTRRKSIEKHKFPLRLNCSMLCAYVFLCICPLIITTIIRKATLFPMKYPLAEYLGHKFDWRSSTHFIFFPIKWFMQRWDWRRRRKCDEDVF